MGVIVYVSNTSASSGLKKKCSAITGYLRCHNIEFEEIDLSIHTDAKDVMRAKIPADIKEKIQSPILPPQVFNEDEYCGDYDMFFNAQEMELLATFFKLEPCEKNLKSINWNKTTDKENDPNIGNVAQSKSQIEDCKSTPVVIGDVKGEGGEDSMGQRENGPSSDTTDAGVIKSDDGEKEGDLKEKVIAAEGGDEIQKEDNPTSDTTEIKADDLKKPSKEDGGEIKKEDNKSDPKSDVAEIKADDAEEEGDLKDQSKEELDDGSK